MTSISCILFDLDGTLYDSLAYNEYFDSKMRAIVAEFLHVDLNDATGLLRERRKEYGTLTRAMGSLGINRLEFHRLVAEHVDPTIYLSSDRRTREVIDHLRERGLKVGLVSNSGRELVRKILNALSLPPQLFDVIVTGTDVEPKPSHQPFLLALEQIGCDRAHTMYVGDREETELRPAHELGLKTVLIARTADREHPPKWADVTIKNIAELEKVIIN